MAVNFRRKVYSVQRGAFSEDGIVKFVRELLAGRSGVKALTGDIPPIAGTKPWDGKDVHVSQD